MTASLGTNSAIVFFPMPRANRDERLDQQAVHRAVGEVPDVVAVDLQIVEGEVLEIEEGAETDAEVERWSIGVHSPHDQPHRKDPKVVADRKEALKPFSRPKGRRMF